LSGTTPYDTVESIEPRMFPRHYLFLFLVCFPGQFAQYICDETAKWSKIVKAAGIKLEN